MGFKFLATKDTKGTKVCVVEDPLIKSFAGVQGTVFQKSPLAAGGKKGDKNV